MIVSYCVFCYLHRDSLFLFLFALSMSARFAINTNSLAVAFFVFINVFFISCIGNRSVSEVVLILWLPDIVIKIEMLASKQRNGFFSNSPSLLTFRYDNGVIKTNATDADSVNVFTALLLFCSGSAMIHLAGCLNYAICHRRLIAWKYHGTNRTILTSQTCESSRDLNWAATRMQTIQPNVSIDLHTT